MSNLDEQMIDIKAETPTVEFLEKTISRYRGSQRVSVLDFDAALDLLDRLRELGWTLTRPPVSDPIPRKIVIPISITLRPGRRWYTIEGNPINLARLDHRLIRSISKEELDELDGSLLGSPTLYYANDGLVIFWPTPAYKQEISGFSVIHPPALGQEAPSASSQS